MKKLILFSFLILSHLQANFTDDDLGNGKYSVTYIQADDMGPQDAKQEALVHAAEIAHKNGYRYFTLDSEEQVTIMQSPEFEGMDNYNRFQEDIVEGQFGRGSIERRSTPEPSIETYEGIKITITGYKKKPAKGKIYDVCNLIDCSR